MVVQVTLGYLEACWVLAAPEGQLFHSSWADHPLCKALQWRSYLKRILVFCCHKQPWSSMRHQLYHRLPGTSLYESRKTKTCLSVQPGARCRTTRLSLKITRSTETSFSTLYCLTGKAQLNYKLCLQDALFMTSWTHNLKAWNWLEMSRRRLMNCARFMCSLSSLPTEAESVRKQIRTRSVLFIFKTFIPACLHQTVTEIMLLSTQMRANFFAMISTNDPSDPMETSIMHVCSPVSKHAFILFIFFFAPQFIQTGIRQLVKRFHVSYYLPKFKLACVCTRIKAYFFWRR